MARLEFELAYNDSGVQRFNHYVTKTPLFTKQGVEGDKWWECNWAKTKSRDELENAKGRER